MRKKMIFLWIDDESNRLKDAQNLERLLGVSVVFEDVSKKNITVELKRILDGNKPDLILMDHRLDKVKSDVISTGSTVAEIIRERWPECPIICVTGIRLEDVDLHQKGIYEDLYEIDKLSEHYPSMLSIAQSFKILNTKWPKNFNAMSKLIKAPDEDKDRLKSIAPDELKEKKYTDKSYFIIISKWIRHTLMLKPGFLYDRLRTATLIGIKEKSLRKVEKLFKQAKYDGIFADDANERWWQTKIKEILYENFAKGDDKFPWVIARNLSILSKRDYSICSVCGKEFPETVGYTDEAARTLEPMHLRCSEPHPTFKKSLFFDEIRMMKAAE